MPLASAAVDSVTPLPPTSEELPPDGSFLLAALSPQRASVCVMVTSTAPTSPDGTHQAARPLASGDVSCDSIDVVNLSSGMPSPPAASQRLSRLAHSPSGEAGGTSGRRQELADTAALLASGPAPMESVLGSSPGPSGCISADPRELQSALREDGDAESWDSISCGSVPRGLGPPCASAPGVPLAGPAAPVAAPGPSAHQPHTEPPSVISRDLPSGPSAQSGAGERGRRLGAVHDMFVPLYRECVQLPSPQGWSAVWGNLFRSTAK